MKLLILTQAVDAHNPVLGFFHRWIEEFARRYEHITVICLYRGTYALPENVTVLSLGKEEGLSRLGYVRRFYSYIWRERKNYNAVFVHMNSEYVVLGGLFWRFSRKRIGLWYNHTKGTPLTRISMLLSHIVFHTSPYAFTARTSKSSRMPAGIDTDTFTKRTGGEKIPHSVLYLGRLSPIKGAHTLLEAMRLAHDSGKAFTLNIYGDAKDKRYKDALLRAAVGLGTVFHGSVPHHAAPEIYNRHDVFVNLTPRGNYDKTILEAMACESLVLTSSAAFHEVLPKELCFKEGDPKDLFHKLDFLLQLHPAAKEKLGRKLRAYVVQNHNLELLARTLIERL